MIGEIWDKEMAEMACWTALVDRMVLSMLHTNSAEGTFVRLANLRLPDKFM